MLEQHEIEFEYREYRNEPLSAAELRKLLPRLDGSSAGREALMERWRMFTAAHAAATDRPEGEDAPKEPRGTEAAGEEATKEVETVIVRPSGPEQEPPEGSEAGAVRESAT